MSYEQLTKGRYSAPGHEYHLTVCTDKRRAHFANTQVANTFCQTLQSLVAQKRITPLCWVLMPDHFHMLLRLSEAQELAKAMNQLKGLTARNCNLAMERQGSLWQRGYFDHALRSEEDRIALARYIVANPLRAGLVKRVGDYPYWDCVWL